MSVFQDKWSQLKLNSKDIFNRAVHNSTEAYEHVHNFLFGVNLGEELELASVRSRSSSTIKKKSIVQLPIGVDSGTDEYYDEIENCRNLIVCASTLFRKGPIPIESLSHQDQIRLSRLGCLKEWDDSDIATSDNEVDFQENPVSKSLLSYFSR